MKEDAFSTQEQLRILLVEDSALDAELVSYELSRHKLQFVTRRVWSEADLVMTLAEFEPNIILSDYSMPSMNGLRSLEIAHELASDVPFIFVSGTIGEERAIEALRNGATDYVLKTNLGRLGPAVRRALRETADRDARHALEVARQQLATILEATPDFVSICDVDMTMKYINAGGQKVLDLQVLPPHGLNASEYLPAATRELLMREAMPHAMQFGTWRGETELMNLHGEYIPVSLVLIAHPNPDGSIEFLSTIARDVRDRKEYESRIRYLANYDALTGLPNRSLLLDRTVQAIHHGQRSGQQLALLAVDLDRFTLINESFGQATGDQVLREVASRIQQHVGQEDTVARVSADTFVVLLTDAARSDDVLLLANELIEAIGLPLQLKDRELQIGATAGISLFPRDGEDMETLLRNANSALHRAKTQRGGGAQFYNTQMTDEAINRIEAEANVRQALRRNELVLFFQPQFEVGSRRVTGVEALLRWVHPGRGIVPPVQLIPIAEEIGLMPLVGDWVLETACKQAVAWDKLGYAPIRMSVNVSVSQLHAGNLVDRVKWILKTTGLPPSRLELEITESGLMQNVAESTLVLEQLKALGLFIAIDDFGTGYSSLSYLSRLPIDRLKIDQSFIARMVSDKHDREIVQAVLSLAHVLELDVIAEGVETEEQLSFLKANGCPQAQGYLMSRPLAAEKLAAFFDKRPQPLEG
ncbi:EAL domain-containing protein [Uliginosibacterium sp. H3]|uniref:EAL domain-containing protein n=1 Tax=Uliginosibacterium silvisoli TaxID=3114758 RepID=A0ABU6K615_9RHOO|nr:EAL domain-containing protein [Uliginosibacterium sp. H3]